MHSQRSKLLILIALALLCIIPIAAQDADAAYTEALRRIEEARVSEATELDLSHLGLETLPPEIGRLTNLRALYLDHNQLTLLPRELGRLRNVDVITLHDNPLASPPLAIRQQGDQAILSYLQEYDTLMAQQEFQSNVIRVGFFAIIIAIILIVHFWQRWLYRRAMGDEKLKVKRK